MVDENPTSVKMPLASHQQEYTSPTRLLQVDNDG